MQDASIHGIADFLAQSDAVGLFVLSLLLLMSVACWYLIAWKAWRNWQSRQGAQAFLEGYRASATETDLELLLRDQNGGHAFARLARQGLDVRRHHGGTLPDGSEDKALTELLTRSLRGLITRETAALESGLTVLGSIASTAPFVGLFGTVWGIYHALIGIGQSGAATLDTVAGPVGEALIMTATGLAVAIPAVLAYNGFSRGNRLALVELDGFAHDLLVFLASGRNAAARRDAQTLPAALQLAGKGAA